MSGEGELPKRTVEVPAVVGRGVRAVATGARRVFRNADQLISDALAKASIKRPY
jgi:hypothetical protein